MSDLSEIGALSDIYASYENNVRKSKEKLFLADNQKGFWVIIKLEMLDSEI
jgi:hypothetical protein